MAIPPNTLRQLRILQSELTQPELTETVQTPVDPTFAPRPATIDENTWKQLKILHRQLSAPPENIDIPAERQEGWDVPTGDIATDVKNLIFNVPRSAQSAVEGFTSLFTSPVETARTFGKIGGGALDVVLGLGEESEDAKLAREAFKQATRLLRDPTGTLINDPVGALLDVAGLAGGAGLLARAGGLAKTASALGSVERWTSPMTITTKLVGKGFRKGLSKSRNAAIAALGMTTGTGTRTLETLLDVGKAGGFRKDFSKQLLKGDKDMSEAATAAVRAANNSNALASMRFQDALDQLEFKNPSNPINPKAVRLQIFREMEEAFPGELSINFDGPNGIELQINKNSSFAHTGEQNRLKGMVEILKSWGDDPTWTKAHRVQQTMDKFIENGLQKNLFKDSNRILVNARQAIRSELGAKVKGFDEMAAKYEGDITAINVIRQALGLKKKEAVPEFATLVATEIPTSFDEVTLTKLGNTLNDRGSGNLGRRRAALQVLDEANIEKQLLDAGVRVDDKLKLLREMGDDTPDKRLGQLLELANRENVQVIPLRDMIASIRVADEAAVGLARARPGQGLGGGALAGGWAFDMFGGFGIGAAGAAGMVLSKWLGNMTIRNPRTVGRFMLGLGALERHAIQVQRIFQQVADNTPVQLVRQGITFSAALERMGDREKVKRAAERVLGPIGF